MPELPEAITVTKDLKKEILNETLIKFTTVNQHRKIILSHQINNKRVIDVFNLGKQIIIQLENNAYISIHLGMTGQLLLNKTDKYEKALFEFTSNKKIHFSDIRKFGHLIELTADQLQKQISNLGVNILENFDKHNLIKRLQKRKIPIKNALIDQRLISGVGNIYATDALYLSKINPNKPTNEISDEEYEILLTNLKELLNEGIKHRGSSMNRYVDLYQNKGSHQNHFRVYKKKNEICINCKTPVKFEKLSGRGSYYCPTCQAL